MPEQTAWGKLKNLVMEPEEQKPDVSDTETNNVDTPVMTATTQSAPIASASFTADQQKMFAGMLEKLTAQVFTRTTALVQFRTALKSLEPVISDVATRYKAAFAMLSSSGVTVESLLNAVKVHTNDLQSEANRFNQETERQLQNVVVQPTARIKELENAQQADKDTLSTIQERMTKRVEEMTTLKKEITDADASVRNVTSVFNSAEVTVSKTLEQETVNITTYLK